MKIASNFDFKNFNFIYCNKYNDNILFLIKNFNKSHYKKTSYNNKITIKI